MITEPASAIKQEVLQLIDLQIETLRQDSLSSAFVASLGNNLVFLILEFTAALSLIPCCLFSSSFRTLRGLFDGRNYVSTFVDVCVNYNL